MAGALAWCECCKQWTSASGWMAYYLYSVHLHFPISDRLLWRHNSQKKINRLEFVSRLSRVEFEGAQNFWRTRKSLRIERRTSCLPGRVQYQKNRFSDAFFSFARGAISETRILGRFFSFARGWPWPSSPLDEKKFSRTLCLFISFCAHRTESLFAKNGMKMFRFEFTFRCCNCCCPSLLRFYFKFKPWRNHILYMYLNSPLRIRRTVFRSQSSQRAEMYMSSHWQ